MNEFSGLRIEAEDVVRRAFESLWKFIFDTKILIF